MKAKIFNNVEKIEFFVCNFSSELILNKEIKLGELISSEGENLEFLFTCSFI